MKLVESFAIGKYVGRKTGCIAKKEKEIQIQEQTESLLNAFLERIIALRWGPETPELEEERTDFKRNIADKLKPVETLIARNGNSWICGEKLVWVDFLLVYCFSLAKQLVPEMEETLAGLQTHLEKLCENEGFKKYYESLSFNMPPLMWEVPRSVLFKNPVSGEVFKPKFK